MGDSRAALVFPASAKNLVSTNDVVNLTIQSIRFTGNKEYTVGGSALTLKSGGISLDGTVTMATDRVILDIVLSASQTWRTTDAGATLDVEGIVSGKYRLSKADAGTLMLGADNLFNGTTLNAGTLTVGTGKSLGAGQLTLHGGRIQSNMPLTLANAFTVTANSSVGGSNDLTFTGAGRLSAGFALTVTNTGTTTFSGKLSGAGTLVETADIGTLVLASSNSHSGSTLHSGTLLVLTNSALGTGAFTLEGGTLAAGAAVTLANNYAVTGSATIGGTNDLTLRGNGTLTVGKTLTVTTGGTTTFTGTLSGPGNLTEAAAAGMLVLPGANGYTGVTTLTSGTLIVGNNSALGTGTLDFDGGTIQPSGDLTLSNPFTVTNTSTVGGSNNLTFSGLGNLNAGTSLSINPAGTVTLSGGISGAGGLAMLGTGVLMLAGNNTFTGATMVAAGTMLVNGTEASSDVTVSGGATLGGAGTVGSLTAAGAVSPGGPGPGLLQSGNAVLAAGSSFVIKLNGTNAGTDYDQLNVNGTVDLTGGPALDTTVGFASNGGDTFTIIASTGTITGTFDGLPDGAMFSAGGITLQINYPANAVTLTNVSSPVPPSLGPPVDGRKLEPPAREGILDPVGSSMALRHERTGQLAQEEQSPRQSRHEGTRDPGRRLVVEGHAGAADDPLGRQE